MFAGVLYCLSQPKFVPGFETVYKKAHASSKVAD